MVNSISPDIGGFWNRHSGFNSHKSRREENGDTTWTSKYASSQESIQFLGEIMLYLGVTKNRLRFLVGVKRPEQIWRWFNGVTRPSSYYWMRICQLVMWKSLGQLNVIEQTVTIDKQRYKLPDYWRSTSEEPGENSLIRF